MTRLAAFLDKFVFLKNGYSAIAHLLPFGVAALLLLVLSIPQDNLLLELVRALRRPQIWFPAVLLNIIALGIYLISVYVQVRKAYLFPNRNKLRAALTCLWFMVVCTVMASVVLRSASADAFSVAGIWASFLVSSLSLAGIGWSLPTEWIEALGISHPDYTEARRLAGLITETLKSVRNKARASENDVAAVLGNSNKLFEELEKNIDCEPTWAKPDVQVAISALGSFAAEVSAKFSNAHNQTIQDFAQVMNCQKESEYGAVINALKSLGEIWREWKCA
jgi:DNA-binding XRE family transcriptional regulator